MTPQELEQETDFLQHSGLRILTIGTMLTCTASTEGGAKKLDYAVGNEEGLRLIQDGALDVQAQGHPSGLFVLIPLHELAKHTLTLTSALYLRSGSSIAMSDRDTCTGCASSFQSAQR